MNWQFIYWLSDEVGTIPITSLTGTGPEGSNSKSVGNVQAGGMLVIMASTGRWGVERYDSDSKMHHKSPLLFKMCFIVVSWPIAALNKYITYLDWAFRPRAGVLSYVAKYSWYFQELSKGQITKLSFFSWLPATSYMEKSKYTIKAKWAERGKATASQLSLIVCVLWLPLYPSLIPSNYWYTPVKASSKPRTAFFCSINGREDSWDMGSKTLVWWIGRVYVILDFPFAF